MVLVKRPVHSLANGTCPYFLNDQVERASPCMHTHGALVVCRQNLVLHPIVIGEGCSDGCLPQPPRRFHYDLLLCESIALVHGSAVVHKQHISTSSVRRRKSFAWGPGCLTISTGYTLWGGSCCANSGSEEHEREHLLGQELSRNVPQ